jgi:ABC-2 type transport system permease protein
MIAMPPHLAAHAGTVLFKPWMALAAIDPSVEPAVGTSIFLEAHKRNLFDHGSLGDEPVRGLLVASTVAIIVRIVMPLLLLTITAPLIAGDRENGTLRLAASTGVTARQLVLGKLAGAIGPWLIVLVPAAGAAAAAIVWSGGGAAGDLLLRGLALAAIYAVYLTVVLAVGFVISSRARTLRAAWTASLAFWFLTTLVLPVAAVDLARLIAPVPAARELAERIDTERGLEDDFYTHLAAVRTRLLEQHNLSNPEALPIGPYGVTLFEGEEAETALYARRFAELFDRRDRQDALYQWAGLLTPAAALDTASIALSGTDWRHTRHFADTAEAYRRTLVQTINRAIAEMSAAHQYDNARDGLYGSLAPFAYRPPGFTFALTSAYLAIAIVLAWFVVMAAVLAMTVRRFHQV